MSGFVDIVCNLYSPRTVSEGRTGLDEDFKSQVRMPEDMRAGVSIDDYLGRMERAGIDPTRGMAGLKDLEHAVNELGFVGAHWYPHWFAMPPDAAQIYPYYAKCCELDIPIMMQVGQSLVHSRTRRLPSVGRPISCASNAAWDCRSPPPASGCWRKPEATAQAFRDGWVTVGDLARHPDVAEVAVVGAPDERWGETLVAFVTLRPGATLRRAQLAKYCEGWLARFKVPKKLMTLPELPRNASGKILKSELRKSASGA